MKQREAWLINNFKFLLSLEPRILEVVIYIKRKFLKIWYKSRFLFKLLIFNAHMIKQLQLIKQIISDIFFCCLFSKPLKTKNKFFIQPLWRLLRNSNYHSRPLAQHKNLSLRLFVTDSIFINITDYSIFCNFYYIF